MQSCRNPPPILSGCALITTESLPPQAQRQGAVPTPHTWSFVNSLLRLAPQMNMTLGYFILFWATFVAGRWTIFLKLFFPKVVEALAPIFFGRRVQFILVLIIDLNYTTFV